MKIINWIKENYIVSGILVVAAILRFYHLDYQSVWLDEIHTINEANPNKSFSEVYQALMVSEPHPPLYFFIVHILFQIFGYTTFVIRFLAAIIGIAGVFSIYLLGREIFNKKVGMYAMGLLTINYFHLYYSQDARMYPLLFLMTTLSFLYLIKFIKQPSYKSAILYGLFSTLMIYCHFFALFALFSQYLILLYFLIKPFGTERKSFFLYCLTSGLMTLVLYLPTYKLFVKTSEITSIWIQMPTLDVYTQFFKDFFGQSEMVLFFIVALVLLFFIQLFKTENSENLAINPKEDKLIFSFFVLFIWILVTLLLPLIRTYTTLPMLINRYFINILPAVIIIVAIGLSYIRNEIVRYGILSIIVLFSLTDIIVVKHYYKSPNKTQFREVTQFILDNNTAKDPVVTSLSWYFPYFLDNGKVHTTIVDGTLDNYVNEMVQDSTKRKSFWYVDAHGRPFKINENTQKYLDENFSVENNIDLYDTWTKHYVKNSSTLMTVDISKYNPLKEKNGDLVNFTVDNFETNEETVKASGWAYLDGIDATNSKMEIVLISNGQAFRMQNQRVKRDDVNTYFKSSKDISNSGYEAKGFVNKFAAGKYQLGILVSNPNEKKEGLILTDKFFEKK
ncbi:glycosyltransferase family 39 protein [Flavobacterium wongokense]|uniref:glycosyltransferase family 39 protein n=1 Tax=Flavobacterium wongokense TaxID=2910674 RepID=UPI001F310506|nr:glycosyltransferase family 39 protein [Flavobacterium sp. WG47]MCF6131468.1 glycosyltransferase family 39 protein [Flavobacterium sp. WG47]